MNPGDESGAKTQQPDYRRRARTCMRVAVAALPTGLLLGVALGIGDRFVFALEAQSDLLRHVTRRRPTHKWVDLARCRRLVFEHPGFRLSLAGLHRRLGGLEYSRGHRSHRLD